MISDSQGASKNSDGQSTRGVSPPAVTLPKGGGAIKGIGETFAANPVTGTGSLSIPLPLSPGRGGFTPALALSYDSGAGNGPYGLGWSIALPNITRRTDRGLPRYDDDRDSDVYLLSGMEDLVPALRADGSRVEDVRDGYRITRYRPRIEGLFARVERWSNLTDPSDIFWRSISRDNLTTFYGKTAESRIADPGDPTRIFSWLICESRDDKGNAALYDYLAEDGRGVDTRLASESNRTDAARSAGRYLKKVRYGNRISRLVQPDLGQTDWLFELVLDYGDHDGQTPSVQPTESWTVRPDPFSTHRAGFEVRTYRRCRRFLMFHRFEELGPAPKLVRALQLDFDDFAYPQGFETRDELEHAGSTRIGSFLRRIVMTGIADTGLARSTPPLEFSYSRPSVNEDIRLLDATSSADLPGGVDGLRHAWVDLDSEGLSGVFSEQGGAWWYKSNLGEGRLGPQRHVGDAPATEPGTRVEFLDLAGDGRLDVVRFEPPNAGFFERNGGNGWSSFTPFAHQPNLDWDDPNLRFVDLTGDGHADVLVTEAEAISWHAALAEEGFGPRESLTPAADDALGPKLVFHDTTGTVFLADMTGDGLSDLVRIRNGEICYWPNLGYGRFGRKVITDGAPLLDTPELFEPQRIRLADLDGSGVTDLVYLARDGIRLYFNRSGNAWSRAFILAGLPPVDDLTSVSVVDLLANGTACLVWSSPLPGAAPDAVRFIDLMGGRKPHLLIGVENNLGARTQIQYASSTRFYLEDQAAGRPWITRLPFPVQVVERTEIYDDISRNRFVTRFAYHHGHFDGVEREFRGFGMVEQWDTEEFAALSPDPQSPSASNIDLSSHTPPVLTRTWFHTGLHLGREHVSDFFAGLLDDKNFGEYYREPGLTDEQARKLLLDDTVLPPGLSVDEEREACRALKGAMLRQEVFALDGSNEQPHPYSVAEQNFAVRVVQPKGGNRHAVFFSHPHEAISYHYERIPADPRVTHQVTLDVDGFGNVLKSAAVAYGRRQPDPALEPRDQAQQSAIRLTWAENRFTNAVATDDEHRTPVSCESRSFELTGLALEAGRNRFSPDDLLAAGTGAAVLFYEQEPTAGVVQKRLIEHTRTLYRRNDLDGASPLGTVESLAIPHEGYALALTPGLVTGAFGAKVSTAMLAGDGRYVGSEGDDQWWIPSGRIFHSPDAADAPAAELAAAREHFFVPRRFQDAFGHATRVSYDAHDLLVTETRDALGNVVTVGERDDAGTLVTQGNDYRVLQPRLVTDPNGNRAAVSHDALGMVVGTASMGKRNEIPRRGDLLDGFIPDLPDAVMAAHLADPLADPHAILQRAGTRLVYDLFAYHRTKDQDQPSPNVVYGLVRETHDADLAAGEVSRTQYGFTYSDGFGREIQKRAQAEPETPGGPPRWIGSGWTVFNNKGAPVRQFEPFFSSTHRFEFDTRVGVSPYLFYDPVGRVVATLHPDHTWEKVLFDPWRQETWDVNDTVLVVDPKADPDVGDFFRRLPDEAYLPVWHAQRESGALGPEEQVAAEKAAVHAGTPSVAYADSLGRTFLTIAHNRFKRGQNDPVVEEFYATRVMLDIEGNQREVIDAMDRIVMRYDYDMLGVQLHQASMEAGERWSLSDVAGKAIYAWDSRDHQFRTTYDPLRRPVDTFLTDASTSERLVGRMIYGESRQNPETNNLRGKPVELFNQAGLVSTDEYDFKGNLLATRRQFAREYKTMLDWSTSPELEQETFTTRTSYDALGRPTAVATPDASVYRPTFNEANLLDRIDVNLRGAAAATAFVTNIAYDAKGQRVLVAHGNGVTTTYSYDSLTFRLRRLLTLRGTDRLQDLSYTYDPSGNITHIKDDAQQTIYFNNQVVTPSNSYTYDAVYRLIAADGREHIGQTTQPQTTWDDEGRTRLPHPGDGQAMRRYTERYEYDPVGNFVQLVHQASGGNWTRSYTYEEASQIELGKLSNRLSQTAVSANSGVGFESYVHDAHGNMTAMPHLSSMQWDFMDRLSKTSRQVVNDGTAETTYYVYNGAGDRVRKITEKQNGTRKNERTYLGNFEIFCEYEADGITVSLTKETLGVTDEQKRITQINTKIQNNTIITQSIRYHFGNHLGSSSLELDDQALVASYEDYYTYGSTSYQSTASQIETKNRYRFTGMERDDENGLNYHGARYSAPWLARWISCDPLGMTAGINVYSYSNNNPVRYIDPSGLDPQQAGSLSDEELLKLANASPINVRGRPLHQFNKLFSAASRGLINVITAEEFERQQRFHIKQGATIFADSWNQEERWDYAQSTGQEKIDFVESKWRQYLNRKFLDYLYHKAAEWDSATRRMASALPFLRKALMISLMGALGAWAPAADLAVVGTATGAGTAKAALMSAVGTGVLFWQDMSSSTDDSEPPPVAMGSVRGVDPKGPPYPDPAPPNYKVGHPSQRVMDHRKNRARGGHPTDPNNLNPDSWEANARKAGFEGNYQKDVDRYVQQGLAEEDAKGVLFKEDRYIMRDVHARPVDPAALDTLESPMTSSRRRVDWRRITPFWRRGR